MNKLYLSVIFFSFFCLCLLEGSGQNLFDVSRNRVEKKTDFFVADLAAANLVAFKGTYIETLDSLNTLLLQDPENQELYFYRAWCHFVNGAYYKAKVDIEHYLTNSTSEHLYDAYVLIGNIHALRYSYDRAIAYYDQAILTNSSKLLAYLEKSKIYLVSGRFQEGLTFVNKVVKLFPEETILYRYRGTMNLSVNNLKKAYNDFQVVLNRKSTVSDETISQAYLGLANYYFLRNKYDDALNMLEQSIAIIPHNIAYGIIGEIKYYKKDYSGSLKAFNQYMDNGGANSRYYLMIADDYEKLGNYGMACLFYGYQIEMFPGDSKTRTRMKKINCQ